MRKSKFTEEQIVYALKQAELGIGVLDVCRKYGVSEQTFYRWRKKYGGLEEVNCGASSSSKMRTGR